MGQPALHSATCKREPTIPGTSTTSSSVATSSSTPSGVQVHFAYLDHSLPTLVGKGRKKEPKASVGTSTP